MKIYDIDFEKSLQIFNESKQLLQIKECYKNIFNLVSIYDEFFKEWQVCYGYLQLKDNLWCRHCFILNNDKIIDPSIFLTKNNIKNNKYVIFKIFDNLDNYLQAIEQNNLLVDLIDILLNEDINLQKEMLKNSQICI